MQNNIIKELRAKYNLTQQQLVDDLHLQTRSTVSGWETGRRNVSKHMLALIADKYNLDYNALLDGDIVELVNNIVNDDINSVDMIDSLTDYVNTLSDSDKIAVSEFLDFLSTSIRANVKSSKKRA